MRRRGQVVRESCLVRKYRLSELDMQRSQVFRVYQTNNSPFGSYQGTRVFLDQAFWVLNAAHWRVRVAMAMAPFFQELSGRINRQELPAQTDAPEAGGPWSPVGNTTGESQCPPRAQGLGWFIWPASEFLLRMISVSTETGWGQKRVNLRWHVLSLIH